MTRQRGFITMFNLTKHANKRLNQRGITGKTFKLFMQYADREVNVGSGDFETPGAVKKHSLNQ